MNASSSAPLKVVALITALIFCSNQIVFAVGDFLPQESSSITPPPVQAVSETSQASTASAPLPATTSTDFLAQTLTLQPSDAQADPAQTVSYDPKLTTANVTMVPGSPSPYIEEGSSAGTGLSYVASTTQAVLKYDVTNPEDTSGFTVSFDNASTATVEMANLSTLPSLTFGFKGPAASATFEIVDSLGHKDIFILSGISSSVERFWSIPLASVSSEVDKTKIKQLNFIVAQTDTVLATMQGTLSIRVKGLKTTAPVVPVVNSASSLLTNQAIFVLSGAKEANTAILINGVVAVPRNSATTWSATVPLTVEGNNTFSITSKNSIGMISTVLTATVKKDTVKPTGTININSSALYAASQTVTLNLFGTDASSGVSSMSFSTDNQSWTTPVVYATSKPFTLPVGDGTKIVFVKYFDKAGNASLVCSKSILLDMTQPTGSITINSGATYATSTAVTLNLSGADSGSGIAKMSFSTNGTTWTVAEACAASKAFALPTGDGNKIVYVRYYDKAGNVSQSFSSSIILDTLAPVGTVKVNGGASYINQAAVILNLSATDAGSGLKNMSFSTDGTTWTTAEAYATTKAWTFTAGDGAKKVFVRFQDNTNRWSTAVSVSVTMDTVKPTGTININSSALYAASQTVTLNLSGTDASSGISIMSFSTDNTNWTTSVAYSTSKTFTLPAGDGTKTVYVKYYDKAGNASLVYSKSILLDMTQPTGTIAINSGATYATSTVVTLNLSGADSGSGISLMSFSTNNTTWTTAETYAASKAFTLPTGDGAKTVYVRYYDKAGNVSQMFSSAIILDMLAPVGTVKVNGGATSINQTAVTLNLAATDAGSGLKNMIFSTDGTTWTPAEAYATTKAWTFPAGDGAKKLYVRFQDNTNRWSTAVSVAVTMDTVKPTGSININSGVTYAATQAVTLNLSGTDASSGISMMSFSSDNTNWTTPVAYATSKTFTLPAGDGIKTVYVKYFDRAGSASLVYSKSITLDMLSPKGTVTVNNGAQYINQAVVMLSLSASDTGSGLSKMSFSPNGTTWTTAENYTTTRVWTFPTGDGAKKVYVKFQDKTGKWSTPSSVTVTLDTIAPAVVLDVATPSLINVKTLTVNYTLEGVVKTKSFTGLAEGVNHLSITETDLAGNSTVKTFDVTVDTVAPTGFVVINDGAEYVNSRTVSLGLTATDEGSGFDKVRYSVDNGATWTGWEDYTATKSVELPAGEGEKTVQYQIRDKAGNVFTGSSTIILDTVPPIVRFSVPSITDDPWISVIYWPDYESIPSIGGVMLTQEGPNEVKRTFEDPAGNVTEIVCTVTLDTIAPTGSVVINNGDVYTNSSTISLSLTGTDPGVGLDGIRFSMDGGAAWTSWEAFISTKSLALSSDDGTKQVLFQLRDKAGNVSSDFLDSIILDTIAPAVVADPATPTLINVKTLTVNYTLEGVAKTKSFTGLSEGVNHLSITETDLAGNQTIVTHNVMVDTLAPTGSFVINNGASQTTEREVTLTLTGSDALSGVSQMRFSLNSGTTWTSWEPFVSTKELSLIGSSGNKEVQYQLQDQAGNLSQVYSRSITLNLNTIPMIQFTSSTVVADPDYLLTYTVNGTFQSERWQLSAGVNPLLVRVFGDPSTFERLDVTLNQSEIVVPDMPSLPALAEGLVSVTAQNGLVIKYDGGTVVSIENPGVYQLFLPQFDASGMLTDGVLQFSNGDKLLYQNSKPVSKISVTGERTVYNSTGTVNSVIEPDGSKIRFGYRVDDQGKALSVLSMDDSATSLYEGGSPSRILIQDGSDIRYEDGLLSSYRDVSGNVFQYQITELQSSGTISGYKSVLSAVTLAGSSSVIPFSQVSANLSQYPSIQSALDNKISTEIDYDANSRMTKFTSGKGEILTLKNQLPESLRDASGHFKLFENTINVSGDLSSVSLSQNSIPSQDFDARGNIRALTLSDGTVFQVTDNKLGAITLSDGSILTGLRWNAATQIMTDYVRTYADGAKITYANSHLVREEEPGGNVTTYIIVNGVDQPDLLTTADGRTYHFVTYKNAQGLTDRRTELVKVVLSDGSRVELESGKPVRYIRSEQVQLDPFNVPVLSSGRSYVASVVLPNAELRSLTIDSTGSILSGEILFNDGTQYFIKNGALIKQITADGKIVEVQSADPIPFEKPIPIAPEPLSSAEINYRDELVDAQFNYFTDQLGIDADTGMPVDNYLNDTRQPSDYSQATLVGFWAEILAAIAKGDYAPSSMNQAQAFRKLEFLLAELQKVQSQAGWNGMFSFFKISKNTVPVYDATGELIGTQVAIRYSRQFDNIGIGDNLNLSVSLASVLGALSGLTLQDPALASSRESIVASIHSILSLQDVGYAQFYDASVKRFHSARNFYSNGSSYWNGGHMDRVFNEFLPGLVWLAARNPSYKPALDNLDVTIRPYQTQNGTQIENAVPFDGGAFQMFWPLMHVDETKYPEFNVALRNFLYTQAEFASQKGIPGLLSAGDDPGNGYNGKIGLPAAAETDDVLSTHIGSLYGTAGAFLLAPHYTLQFLKNIEAKFPGIRTSAGLVDSVALKNGEAVFSDQAFGVDQASFILSLLGTSQNYFTQYLQQNGLASNFDALYEGMSFNLAPVASENPELPTFGLSTPVLYSGTNPQPDGLMNALTKRSSFISTLVDPEFGEGRIYDYLDPAGNFHNTEIEFGDENSLKKMTLAQYLLLPGREDMSRSLFSSVSLDLLNEATTQGSFYTSGRGYANSSLVTDSIGEVRHIDFDLEQTTLPVGLYALYDNRDLSQYDYISVPVRLGPNAPDGVSLKFEFAGMGEVFVTGNLTRDWQYFQIPVAKPAGLLQKIAVVIQSPDGGAVSGDVYLGPLSAFKVRTSNQVDWQAMLGKSDIEIRGLLKSQVLLQPAGGGTVEADEVLEDFTLDSEGNLVNGVMKRADGSIQYFHDGQLMKWVFRNGRTVLFEKGLATFVLDLARGRLEEGRFYYDETFRGEIQSFVMQDNDSKRVYGADGKLQTIVENGRVTHFKNGIIDSIVLPESMLTQLVFADDQSLLQAHVKMNDGREFDIDQGGEQTIVRPNGVKVYYKGTRIIGVETSQNGKTAFTYTLNGKGQMTGVEAIFDETVVDDFGNLSVVTRTLSLFDYLLRSERSPEKQEVLREPPQQIIPIAGIGGFSVGYLPGGELTYGMKLSQPDGTQYGWYKFRYNSLSGPILGMVAGNYSQPINLSGYDFIQLTLEQDPSMTWNQDFNFVLKTPTRQTLYSFELDNIPNQYQSFGFSLAGKSGSEGEMTLEVVREAGGVGKTGLVYIKDISYLAIKSIDHPLWENYLSISASELQGLKVEADTFTSVGAEVASHVPLSYKDLVSLLDMPSSISYSDKDSAHLGQLVGFKRFDGAEVSVSGSDVTRVVLPDGTVNEYSAQGNTPQGTIRDSSAADPEVGSLDYRYGELRKITQSDGKIYELSYEFDVQGNPITVIKEGLTGDIRRFKDGKLMESASSGGVSTTYEYQNGELIGAELFYKNRVLQSSIYKFVAGETQVTDDDGTTWYYDTNGNLIKHLTKDGYLYAYSDYSATPQNPQDMPQDYKWTNVFNATDLRAVSLVGYEAKDGMQVKKGDEGLVEIDSPAGDKAVNVVLDDARKIKNGQIQFADGLILEIENYLPVRGRLTSGALFSTNFPTGSTQTTLLQDSTGAYTGSMFQINGTYYSYDACGFLKKIASPNGESYQFTYPTDASGNATAYDVLHHKQVDFNGVPFPEELTIQAGDDMTLSGSNGVLAEREGAPGFMISAYDESLNQWKVLSGQFSSEGDRILLRNFLTSLKAGQYVAAAVKDPNFSQAGDEILSLLEGIGAGQVRAASAGNQTWYLFGNEYLKKGEGREQTGGSFFLTATENTTHVSLSGVSSPVFNGASLILSVPETVADSYSSFLKAYEPNKPGGNLEEITVYNTQNQIVFSEALDGTRTFYDKGKPRETYTSGGELLYTHEYGCPAGGCQDPGDPFLLKVALVKARLDFETESAKARQQIEQVKFDALQQLAEQENVAQANIKQEVANSIAALDAYIGQLQGQRYRKVKTCRSVFFGLGKACKENTVEVPGIAGMIGEAQNQKVELLQNIQPAQIATIPALIAQKKLEIEAATAQKMADLSGQERSVFHDILEREVAPVLADIYRRLLGRDPSTEDVDAEIARFGIMQSIDLNRTVAEIESSGEFRNRTNDKVAIINQVRTFLNAYAAAANDPAARAQMAQSLRLDPSEVVDLNQEEVTAIIRWLENRDLHFGQSAFLSLKNMLSSRGFDAPMVTLGYEALLVDILTGTINKFSEGDLVISVFAFQRVAKLHGADIAGVSYALEDLKNLYQSGCGLRSESCSLRVIAHVEGDHFVVITAVTSEGVTFLETNRGLAGELVTETFDQFMKIWDAGHGTGHLVVYKDQAIPSKMISDQMAMKIRGSFFGILIFWFAVASIALTAASVVVSYISPTFGKILGYAAMVAGIVAIAASVVNFAVQGFSMALSSINSVGLLQSVQNGFTALGSAIWEGVAHVGQFLKQGFTFFADVFTGKFSALGAGITNMGKFVMDGVKVLFDPAGALVPQKLTFGQMVGRNMIAAAINIPVSKGLEGFGLDSRMTRLAGAFVSGGMLGLGGGVTGFMQSGVQAYLLQGVSEIGLKLNLPPPITAALSIATHASLASFFDPITFSLKTTLPQIFPSFTQQLTLGGIELLGRSLGLDPRIADLLGLPVAAAVGGITRDLLNPNGMASMWQSIQNAVLSREMVGGIVSIGAGFAVDKLGLDHSFFTALTSRIVAGVMEDFLTKRNRMSLVDSIITSVDNSIYHALDPKNLPVLFSAISEKGLAEGFDQYATMILTQDTIEEFTSAGMTFTQIITAGMPFARDIFLQSGPAKMLQAVKNGKTVEFIFRTLGDNRLQILGIYEKNAIGERWVQWDIDELGNMTGVTAAEVMPDGTKRQDTLSPDGDLRKIEFKDWGDKTFATLSYNAQGAIEFNNYNLGIAGHLSSDGQFQFNLTGAPDLQDFDNFIYDFNISNLAGQKQGQFFTLFTGNGFWNEHGALDDASPHSINFIHNITDDQANNGVPAFVLLDEHGNIAHDANGNVLTTASLPVTLYSETGLIGNVLRWTAETWFGCNFMRDKIESDLKNYFDLIDLNINKYGLDPNIQNIYFAHSGNFQPLIKALEDMDPKYQQRLKTLIVYEGPYVGDGVINDPYLQTLIRVRGSADGLSVPFLDHREFKIADANGNVSSLQNQYNIEIVGAGHSDFDANANPKVNLFMRDLALVAGDQTKLERFLSAKTPGISIEDGIIKLDPTVYVSPNGER